MAITTKNFKEMQKLVEEYKLKIQEEISNFMEKKTGEKKLDYSKLGYIMLKPGFVKAEILNDISKKMKEYNLQMVTCNGLQYDKGTAKLHYLDISHKPFIGELTDYLSSGACLGIVVYSDKEMFIDANGKQIKVDYPDVLGEIIGEKDGNAEDIRVISVNSENGKKISVDENGKINTITCIDKIREIACGKGGDTRHVKRGSIRYEYGIWKNESLKGVIEVATPDEVDITKNVMHATGDVADVKGELICFINGAAQERALNHIRVESLNKDTKKL